MTFYTEQPGIEFVPIPAGKFLMGSPETEAGRYSDEGPQHQVTLEAFYLSRTPITQAQWKVVAGWPTVERQLDPNPSMFQGDDRPVEGVNWYDAMEFCARLSRRTGRTYTLPSEAQWEYACRAGTTTPFHCGETLSEELANYDSGNNCPNQTTRVGMYPPNAWGLHDMHGNVWEWCLDDWHPNYHGAPTDGSAWLAEASLGKSVAAVPGAAPRIAAAVPAAGGRFDGGPTTSSASVCVEDAESLGKCSGGGAGTANRGTAAQRPATASTTPMPTSTSAFVSAEGGNGNSLKALRGGSWASSPVRCRSAYRNHIHPAHALNHIGFRVCCLP